MNEGWSLTPLGEILKKSEEWIDINPERRYKQITVKIWGKGVIERNEVSGAEISGSKRLKVKAGEFIVSRIDARHGAFGLIPDFLEGAIVTNDFPIFKPKSNKILPKYLDWMSKTRSFVDLCVAASEGTTNRVRLKEDRFLSMQIPLPPLDEQRRIVARIEELAAKVEEARGLRRQSVEEAEALTWAGSTQLLKTISPDGILGHFLNEKPRNGWSAPCNNMPEGIPVLSLGAITGFRYRETEFKRTSECVFDDAHYWLRPGDLLMTRSNTSELVGHAAIYNGYPSPCIYPDLMMRLDVNESKADKYFVLHWLSCVLVRDYIKAKAKGTSPTMKKITQDVVVNVPFPSNLPLPEQRRIVAYLDDLQSKVDALKRLQTETAAELDALLPSILDKAFKGEL
jgi:type I restriction enzyme S subunit